MNYSKTYIDGLIKAIKTAENPESVTNVMVAAVMEYLSDVSAKYSDIEQKVISMIDAVLGENASQAIENFTEVLDFLSGCKDSETLQGILNVLRETATTQGLAIGTLEEAVDTLETSVDSLEESLADLDVRTGIEDFVGIVGTASEVEDSAYTAGVWFVEDNGSFVEKSSAGAVSPAGVRYNLLSSTQGQTANARTDKVYRDTEGGLWHVAYDAEARNYVLLAYVDEATLEQKVSSAESRLETALDTAKGRITELEDSVEKIGVKAIAGEAMSLQQLSQVSRAAGVWYVRNTGLFYVKGTKGDVEEAGPDYNDIPTEQETVLGATAHGRTDRVYRGPDGSLFRLVDNGKAYVFTAFVDSLSLEEKLGEVNSKIETLKEEDTALNEAVKLEQKRREQECGELSETTQELRREIVGLWDETAKIQAKLADLHSTETENLLKRLGYGPEDIEEYIWAVSHLDLDISLEDLRRSVAAWEAGEDRGQKVAPKWTEEMEAGEETPAGLKASRFNSALYYPHITTGKGFWLGGNSGFGQGAGYAAGLHATAPCQVTISIVNNDCGLGSFTGQISKFSLSRNYRIRCLKLLQSETSIDLSYAFINQTYVDFRNVHVENATNLSGFATFMWYWGSVTSLPAGFSETDKTMNITHALAGHKFVGESIDLADRWFNARDIFSAPGYSGSFNKHNASEFDNCDIDVSKSRDLDCDLKLFYFGYFIATEGKVSRIKAHGVRKIDPSALVAYQDKDCFHKHCGVWEVDCPDAEEIATDYCAGATCATFWNLGASLTSKTIALDRLTSPYQGMRSSSGDKMVSGFLDVHEVLRDSFRNAMRSWVSPPEACVLEMSYEQYNSLSEEDIAELSEKGYTVALVYRQIGGSSIQAAFKFE